MAYFVFAEFGNPPVIDFLSQLRNILQGKPVTSPIHVTLRGPYNEPPPPQMLETYAERLCGYGVRIGSHGCFKTPNGYAVFLRAECSVFRELWDKPDYKTSLALIQPHITLFESDNRETALLVRDFLRRENLLIHTYNIYLSVYQSRAMQGDFFGHPPAFPSGRTISSDLWRVPEDFLERAKALGSRISQENDGA
ncbi:MAG: hypothetical protein KKA22_01200 [Gammaproteobacteria bacterium]|nr:hypothetical protein [Gammaproteobacteria bacterium]MBU1406745.1 hypothetical protein [Gammaproteobacteria bacterium]MBU1533377.1 hypothetical protein [Gammaproteobacteria bacterium]